MGILPGAAFIFCLFLLELDVSGMIGVKWQSAGLCDTNSAVSLPEIVFRTSAAEIHNAN